MGKWEMVRLGDVCEINPKQLPLDDYTEVSFIPMASVSENGVIDVSQVAKYKDVKKGFSSFADGDVLFAKITPCMENGKGGIVNGLSSGIGFGSTEFHILRNNPEKIFSEWLFLFTHWSRFRKLAKINMTGSAGQKRVPKTFLSDTKIPLPPLDEQKRIAKNLDLASEIIKGYKEQLAELDKLVQSVFYEMFGDPVTNEKGWETTNLGRCIELLSDFSANGAYEYLDSHVKMYDEPNYALMIRTTDLEKNDFTNGVKYIDENAYKILEKSKVFGNEIIMSKIGSAGKIYLMPKLGMPVSLGRNAFLIRLKQNTDVIFLYNLLSTNYGKTEIMQYVRGAVTKTITKDSVRAIRIVLPPLELQTRFASIVTEIETQKAQVQQALTKAENLFNSLMQEYFE